MTLLGLPGALFQLMIQHKVRCMQERIDYSTSANSIYLSVAEHRSSWSWKSDNYYKHVCDLAEIARVSTHSAMGKEYRIA